MNYETVPVAPFGIMVCATGAMRDAAELPIAALRELVRRHHLLVVRGFAPFASSDAFADYCGRWGAVSVWPFGKVLELIEQEAPQDHIFDNNYVPLHWDGMYRPQVPELQIFHCASAPLAGQGGRTTFSNTVLALENAPRAARELWEKVTGVYHRKMEYYDSKTISPIVTRHPDRGFPVIRYNEPPREGDSTFVNRPTLAFTGVSDEELAEFHRSLREALYAKANFYAHPWREGDLVISDNYTLLHGREAFVSRAPRHLQRVHVLGDPPLDNPGLVAYQ
ncbi:TauD/TfdA dioxygenase family protein [Pendulispora albinea]|uniref:TauD/TfdA family dioxygenase n=1 Tax=Pendulispora albinea TaxID=2741071 RepID=A0ABZ2M4N5_9BACT